MLLATVSINGPLDLSLPGLDWVQFFVLDLPDGRKFRVGPGLPDYLLDGLPDPLPAGWSTVWLCTAELQGGHETERAMAFKAVAPAPRVTSHTASRAIREGLTGDAFAARWGF